MKSLKRKLNALKERLAGNVRVVIAYSGGLDSSLLAKVAFLVLGDNALAVTVASPLLAQKELRQAKVIAKELKIPHKVIGINQLKNGYFVKNTRLRCFWCKKTVFSRIRRLFPASTILDGTTYSDKEDFRPGMRALRMYGIKSPLYECKLTKDEIREIARDYKLSFWNKLSNTCTATRIPHGEKITQARLRKIRRAEEIICGVLGDAVVFRARDHRHFLRIEFLPHQISRLLKKINRPVVIRKLKSLGYRYVTVDTQGYVPQGLRK